MTNEIISNALGGLVMFAIILIYLGYLLFKLYRGHAVTKWESGVFRALTLIALLGVVVYYVRTQVL